jgi:NAD(P)-dependent dehydrogenase (short-subunit alcohol dehydrogenase family)
MAGPRAPVCGMGCASDGGARGAPAVCQLVAVSTWRYGCSRIYRRTPAHAPSFRLESRPCSGKAPRPRPPARPAVSPPFHHLATGVPHVPVRSDRPGGRRHRFVPRHRPRHRRAAGRAWCACRRVVAQGGRLPARWWTASMRATAPAAPSRWRPASRRRTRCRRWSTARPAAVRPHRRAGVQRRQQPLLRADGRHRRRAVPQDPGQQRAQQPLADQHDGAADDRAQVGSIIIVSSIGGLRGSTTIGAYCISKAADLQLARNLAHEYGPHGVRVNCIAPGLIKHRLRQGAVGEPRDPEARHRGRAAAPHRRARRDRRRGGVPGLEGVHLHDRPGSRLRRRRHDLTTRPEADLRRAPWRGPPEMRMSRFAASADSTTIGASAIRLLSAHERVRHGVRVTLDTTSAPRRAPGCRPTARPRCASRPPAEADICWGGKRFRFQNDAQRQWLQRMGERGWTVPTWPRDYGGGGLSTRPRRRCCARRWRAEVPRAAAELRHLDAGPGAAEVRQRGAEARFLPPIVRGEIRWCQGYSEPNAGSDLASAADPCRRPRRPLPRQRPEDLDFVRRPGRLDLLPGAHRPRPQSTKASASCCSTWSAGRQHPADHADQRQEPVLRDLLRRRSRAEAPTWSGAEQGLGRSPSTC